MNTAQKQERMIAATIEFETMHREYQRLATELENARRRLGAVREMSDALAVIVLPEDALQAFDAVAKEEAEFWRAKYVATWPLLPPLHAKLDELGEERKRLEESVRQDMLGARGKPAAPEA